MEVWRIDNGGANQDQRKTMLALRDLGDNGSAPNNGALYNQVSQLPGIRVASSARSQMNGFNGYQEGEHYLVNENVRKLNPSEYTFYPSLGYISLNQPLVDGEDLWPFHFNIPETVRPA